jgi:hypothetical protein
MENVLTQAEFIGMTAKKRIFFLSISVMIFGKNIKVTSIGRIIKKDVNEKDV